MDGITRCLRCHARAPFHHAACDDRTLVYREYPAANPTRWEMVVATGLALIVTALFWGIFVTFIVATIRAYS